VGSLHWHSLVALHSFIPLLDYLCSLSLGFNYLFMSDQPNKSTGWGLWGSLIETVKQKSETIVNIYKEDLNEFSKTLVNDTTSVLQDRLAALRVFGSNREEKGRNARSPIQQQNRIARLQSHELTFTEDPADADAFAAWSNQFDIGAHTESVTHLLTSNETVREFHTRLVPAQVSYRDFWCRYYYKLHCLLEEDKRRAALLKSATEANDDEELSWDVEEDKQQQSISNPEKGQPKIEDTKESPIEESSSSPPTITSNTTEIAPEEIIAPTQSSPPPSPTVNNPTKDDSIVQQPPTTTTLIEDEIDHEIAQKYVEIQSEKDKDKDKSDKSDDEWASWE